VARMLNKENPVPVAGICLGHQIIALAAGGKTFKLLYGHRSQNQPCQELGSQRCVISSQNHGYAVDPDSLSEEWKLWYTNLNDGTVEGIRHSSLPFFGVQFHPEASPGPTDPNSFFDEFMEVVLGE
jgi:carbamoyl-phosphate synthase small subunit